MIQGISEARRRSISFDAMARAPAGAGGGDPEGPGRRQPVLLHRRRRHQHHAQQRPLPDQSEAAGRAQRRRRPTIIRRLQQETAGVAGHHALHAAGAGPDHRRHGQPHPVPVRAGERRTRRRSTTWVPKLRRRSCSQAPELADVASDLQQQGLAAYIDDRPRHRRALRHHAGDRRQRALRRLRPAHHLDHLHPVQPVPRDPGGRSRRCRRSLDVAGRDLPAVVAPPAARCRCRRSPRSSSRPAPLQINHLGQFPATTISFNLAPGVSLGAAVDGDPRRRSRTSACRRASSPPSRARRWRSRPRWQRAAADPGGDRHRLHRAGRALRELHPPGHDPLDAALGRRRRAAGADARRRRPRRHRASSASSC